ncbi:hypothetical protein MMC19_003028 [Ptychographa xylographoides]|nr:hypothetical protein [Ptychographa xylographoides]
MCSISPQLAADASRFSLDIWQIQELGQAAIKAKDRAHCPYSNFRVGAALLTPSGGYIIGVNVENASYPVGTCAERVAMGKAVSDGEKEFKALAVATDISPPASPCGMCRQFIREFCTLDMPIFMYDSKGAYVVKTLGELLPMSFGPEDLKPNRAGEHGTI